MGKQGFGYDVREGVKGYVAHCTLAKENGTRWLRFQEATLREFVVFVLSRHGPAPFLERLAPADLTDYLVEREAKGDMKATLQRRAVIIRAMARWAEAEGRVKTCPLARARIASRRRFPPELPPFDHLWILIQGCQYETLRDAFGILLRTGLRRGELLALRWQDVDLEQGLAHVRATTAYAPKSRRPRAVPLDAAARAILKGRLDGRLGAGPFRNMTRPVVHETTLTKAWKTLATAAGLEALRLHDLRHAFGTHLVQDLGLDLRTVQVVMGHSSVAVTEIYARARTDSAQHVRRVMDHEAS
jgi:integrase